MIFGNNVENQVQFKNLYERIKHYEMAATLLDQIREYSKSLSEDNLDEKRCQITQNFAC